MVNKSLVLFDEEIGRGNLMENLAKELLIDFDYMFREEDYLKLPVVLNQLQSRTGDDKTAIKMFMKHLLANGEPLVEYIRNNSIRRCYGLNDSKKGIKGFFVLCAEIGESIFKLPEDQMLSSIEKISGKYYVYKLKLLFELLTKK